MEWRYYYVAPAPYAKIEVREVEPPPQELTYVNTQTEVNRVCGCVTYARSLGASLPRGYDAIDYVKWINILPKSPPTVGSVAIFKYGEGRARHHLAYVYKLEETGFIAKEEIAIDGECVRRTRLVEWNDKALLGFYKPLD